MAWMAMMGARSVEYHRATVMERGDDFAGRALEYYGSRGETPLMWGGSGVTALGSLERVVSDHAYGAVFGPGGARDPGTGVQLVETSRTGMELVVSAHKSVAELGVIGLAGIMHGVLDAERDATMGYLDRLTRQRGGRRGRARTATPTAGMIYAHTRHATSRAGDPCPHDHVLVANVVKMGDEAGGWKAADTALWREQLHAATMVGRLAGARAAVDAGLGIEADFGPSGRLGHWRLSGIPDEVLELHSKRSAEIEAHVSDRGWDSPRARGIAARETRKAKRFEPEDQLTVRWRKELTEAGWPASRLRDALDAGRVHRPPGRLSDLEVRDLVACTTGVDGELARVKVFSRAQVVVAVAPHLFGRPLDQLDRVVDAVLAHSEILPLVGVAGAADRHYTLASVVAVEQAIAELVAHGSAEASGPVLAAEAVAAAVKVAQTKLGAGLTKCQLRAIRGMCREGRQVSLLLGVAGAGKTTCLSAVADAYRACGYQVLGAATAGQAARTLGREAGIGQSRTVASLLWRLDHGQVPLDRHSVLIVDEAGTTDDRDLFALLAQARRAGAKVILVGDDRQLGPVGPGGALGALLERHRSLVHVLDENIRQADPGERRALAHLRCGHVAAAVEWYASHQRIRPSLDREAAIASAVAGWAADVSDGRHSVLLAWRRTNVAALNEAARAAWAELGRLSGPVLDVAGRSYAAGDLIVTLAPTPDGLVTSQRGQIVAVDPDPVTVHARMDDGTVHHLTGEQLAADRLAHAYALTVHRAQGATVECCHHLADGGGRQLAYVAMSRARQTTTVHVVADNLEQAIADLTREWGHDRRPHWVIDTAPIAEPDRQDPHPNPVPRERHSRPTRPVQTSAADRRPPRRHALPPPPPMPAPAFRPSSERRL